MWTGSDTLISLDPRAPLVLDTRELGRRPGSSRNVSRSAPAPAGLGIEVLRVPESAPIRLDLLLEAVMEGVLVSGSAAADAVGECVRCLAPVDESVAIELREFYAYDAPENHADDGLDVRRLEGDLIDLEPLIRDSVVLALPFQPLCADDCPGLCPECGTRLAEDQGHAHEAAIDPRWASLVSLHESRSGPERPA
ncbi:MAG: YceD family protein [Nocardioides sp.]